VEPPAPAFGVPGHAAAVLPTGQSIGCVRIRWGVASVYSPMSTSPGTFGLSGWRPSLLRKSLAYQSLHASPIAPAWAEFSAPAPSASVTSRLERPCVYSW
jgi:hypothetical protein